MSKFLFIVFISFFTINNLICQTDTEFWFAVPDISVNHGLSRNTPGDHPIYFNISTQDYDAKITIEEPANPNFTPLHYTLAANTSLRIDLTPYIEEIENKLPSDNASKVEFNNKGIHITSTSFITVYYESNGESNPEIFSLKGKNALGTRFYSVFQQRTNNGYVDGYTGFLIVATEDSTLVTITPSTTLFGNPNHPANVPFTILLNKGETFFGTGGIKAGSLTRTSIESYNHPSGSLITTNGKKIVVILSDDSSRSITGGCIDLAGDQTIPTTILGKEYIAIKGRGVNLEERVIIVATANNEKIFINGNYYTTINAGQTLDYTLIQKYNHISSKDSGIYVFQISGDNCEMGGAILPPTDMCTGSSELSFSRSGYFGFYLSILVRKGAENSFLINGNPSPILDGSFFQPIPGTSDWLAYITPNLPVNVIIPNQAITISNTKDFFHLGMINSNEKGTSFGYFSNFNTFNTNVINTSNGEPYYHACHGEKTRFTATGGIRSGFSNSVTYKWSNGATTPYIEFTPTKSETVYVTVTTNNSCNISLVDSGVVSVGIPTKIETGNDSICLGQHILISATNSPILSYKWNTGDTIASFDIQPKNTTKYNVTVTDTANCIIKDSVLIKVVPKIEINFGGDTVSGCLGTIYTLNPQINTNFHFLWNTGDTSSKLDIIKPGNYFLTISQAGSCNDNDTVYVKFNPIPDAEIKANRLSVCRNEETRLIASGGINYKWNSGENDVIITPAPLHSQYYKLTATNEYNCENTDSIFITVKATPNSKIISGEDSIYVNQKNSIYSVLQEPGHSYFWKPITGGSITSGNNSSSININWGSIPQKTTLFLTEYIDATGCNINDSLIVQLVFPPQINIINKKNINCYNAQNGFIETSVIGGIYPLKIVWNDLSTSLTRNKLDKGIYQLIVSDKNLYSDTAIIEIDEPTELIIDSVTIHKITCPNYTDGEIKINISGGIKPYLFYINDSIISIEDSLSNLSGGNYFIQVYDSNFCEKNTSVFIDSPKQFKIEPYIQNPFCDKTTDGLIKIVVSGGTETYQYQWNIDKREDKVENLTSGIYTVTISDANNCKVTASYSILPENDICIKIPTAFSPNNDGINDTWTIQNLYTFYPKAKLEVYDRWGNLVYTNRINNKPWNGYYRNQSLSIDSYHYILDLQDNGKYRNGTITIVR